MAAPTITWRTGQRTFNLHPPSKKVFGILLKIPNSNFKPLSSLFLSGVALIVLLYVVLISATRKNDWIIADWLINYQDGGFKRRGLSGSFFFLLQDLTGLQLNFLIGIVTAFLYTTFTYFFYVFIRKIQISIPLFSLLFSPLTFLFFLNDTAAIGRKEIILFVIFSFYVYLVINNKLSLLKDVMIHLLLAIAILFHELIIFYVLFFPAIKLLVKNNINLKKEFFLLLIPAFATGLLYFSGDAKLDSGNSFQIIHSRGVELNTAKSPLTWEEKNMAAFLISNLRQYAWYLVFFLFGSLHFLYYAFHYLRERFGTIWKLYMLCSLSVIPLFFLGIDWGRWINIYFMLWLIVFAAIWPYSNSPAKLRIYNPVFFTIPCIIALFVSMAHCDKGMSSGIIIKVAEAVARF